MQINRLFEIVYILLDKKTTTAKELSQRFEVSSRTIYRDIETLSAAGIPVYMSKGRGGGISLMQSFVLNKAVLTNNEKADILSSLRAVAAVSPAEDDTALNKLTSLFGEHNADWIEVDFSSWENANDEKEIFNKLKLAILNKKVILFCYFSGKGESMEREAEPLKLCFKGQSWYLYAYCKMRNDYRFFKLRRIKNLVVKGEGFCRKPPAQIFTSHNVFAEECVFLLVRLSAKMAYRVYDEFECFEEQPDGGFIASVRFPKGSWLYEYIISFGEECEVLEPPEVREHIKNKLQNTLNKYL